MRHLAQRFRYHYLFWCGSADLLQDSICVCLHMLRGSHALTLPHIKAVVSRNTRKMDAGTPQTKHPYCQSWEDLSDIRLSFLRVFP